VEVEEIELSEEESELVMPVIPLIPLSMIPSQGVSSRCLGYKTLTPC
jgi:hypothetical protein